MATVVKNMKQKKSEVREKRETISFRVAPVEKLEIQRMADHAGVTVGTYIRNKILKNGVTKNCTVPSFDKVLLAKLIGQIGLVGSDIKKIAEKMNKNGNVPAEHIEHTENYIKTCCDKLSILLDEILKVVKVS